MWRIEPGNLGEIVHRERSFTAGWSGNQARTPGTGSGNGLGLPMGRAIVAAHRGTVDLRNRPPGCEITIELPRAVSGAEIRG